MLFVKLLLRTVVCTIMYIVHPFFVKHDCNSKYLTCTCLNGSAKMCFSFDIP